MKKAIATLHNDVLDRGRPQMIRETMRSGDFPWYFARSNLYPHLQGNKNSDCFCFTHGFFRNNQIVSDFFYMVEPIVEYIKEQYDDIEALLRIKANLYTNQHKGIEYAEHTDQMWAGEKDCLIGLYNAVDCNGGTVINGKTYPSVSNQLILFDNVPHYGISQTDTQTRICINFNFQRKGMK